MHFFRSKPEFWVDIPRNQRSFVRWAWVFFAKFIAEGAINEQKNTRSAAKLPEYEEYQPKTQVSKARVHEIGTAERVSVLLFFRGIS